MPPPDGLVVVRSRVHGYGLETTRRFAAGEIVTAGDGVIFRQGDDFDDTYALVIPAIDAGFRDGPEDELAFYDLVDQTRWINHSCEPNTRVESRWDPIAKIARTWWIALRDIEVGEELFYDYGFVAACAEPCHCGAAACRGLIVDPDEVDGVAEELRHHLRPAIAAPLRATS
jgi:hypothetical protein